MTVEAEAEYDEEIESEYEQCSPLGELPPESTVERGDRKWMFTFQKRFPLVTW